MKYQTALLACLLILSFVPSKAIAQLSLSINGCNNLDVKLTQREVSSIQSNCAFVLEKMLAPGIWESTQKNFENNAVTSFLNVSNGTYRTKLVLDPLSDGNGALPLYSNTVDVRECSSKKQSVLLRISPTPASDNINAMISSFEGGEIFLLYDVTGQKVKSANFSEPQLTISVATLPPGLYFAFVEANSTCIARQKIVIK